MIHLKFDYNQYSSEVHACFPKFSFKIFPPNLMDLWSKILKNSLLNRCKPSNSLFMTNNPSVLLNCFVQRLL